MYKLEENISASEPATTRGSRRMPAWKRTSDVVCALLALPLLALATLLMTAVVFFGSPGPVFFRQLRVGRNGRLFRIFKFRTMRSGANTKVHQDHFRSLILLNSAMQKLDDRRDARMIPGGWLLRASGFDELPQFINVLRGEMSLVGPRPSIPSEYEQMTGPQRERVMVTPGLTGLWQVSGKNRMTFEEMIRLDIHYGRRISAAADLKIVLLTPYAVLVQMSDCIVRRRTSPPMAGPRIHGARSPQATGPLRGVAR